MDIAKPNEPTNDFKSLDILESHLVSSVLVRVGSIHRMLYGQSVLITYALSRTYVTLTIYRTHVMLQLPEMQNVYNRMSLPFYFVTPGGL